MTPKELVQNHIVRQVYLSNEEIAELFQPRQDYESACNSVEGREFRVERDELNDKYFWYEVFSIEVLLQEPDRTEDWQNESDHVFFTEREAWCDCARSNQIAAYEVEVLEVWLISDWLYNQLDRQNESVINWKGLPLWGRTGTGSALYQECLIEEIAATVR